MYIFLEHWADGLVTIHRRETEHQTTEVRDYQPFPLILFPNPKELDLMGVLL